MAAEPRQDLPTDPSLWRHPETGELLDLTDPHDSAAFDYWREHRRRRQPLSRDEVERRFREIVDRWEES